MAPAAYLDALAEARRELAACLEQRTSLEKRIADLRETVTSLARLSGDTQSTDVPNWGITEACREALRSAGADLTGIEVRERLEKAGFSFARYSQPSASMHTVLKRLVKVGEALRRSKYGRPSYQWNPHRGSAGEPAPPADREGPKE